MTNDNPPQPSPQSMADELDEILYGGSGGGWFDSPKIKAALLDLFISKLEKLLERLPDPDNNVEEWRGHNIGLSQTTHLIQQEIDQLSQFKSTTNRSDISG